MRPLDGATLTLHRIAGPPRQPDRECSPARHADETNGIYCVNSGWRPGEQVRVAVGVKEASLSGNTSATSPVTTDCTDFSPALSAISSAYGRRRRPFAPSACTA